jgi:hypothetical protein
MTPELEDRVRERLAGVRLPAAPAELRQFVEELATREPGRRRGFATDRRFLIAVPLVLLVSVAVGISSFGIGPRPTTTAAAPTETAPSAPPLPAGFHRFTAPGISFLYPEAWTSQPIPTDFKDTWSHRYVGFLSDGAPECWLVPSALPTGGSAPPCIESGEVPGSLQLHVSEYAHPVPGEANYNRPLSLGASSTYEMRPGLWYVTDPGGGIYEFAFSTPSGEMDGRRDEIAALIRSITFTDWERPSLPSANGHTQLTTGYGTFSYSQDWVTYKFMPWYVNMAGTGPILLFASKPLEPCIPADGCHLREPPNGAVVIQVSWVMGFGKPNWSEADTSIGGRPAISRTSSIDKGIEHLGWTVQADDGGFATLDFDVALPADSEARSRQLLDEFLAGIDLHEAPPSQAP